MKRKKIVCYLMSMAIAFTSLSGQIVWADADEQIVEENPADDVDELTEEAEDENIEVEDETGEVQQEDLDNGDETETEFSDSSEITDAEDETKTADFSDSAATYSNDDEYYELNKPIKMTSIAYSDEKYPVKSGLWIHIFVTANGRIKVDGENLSQLNDVLSGSKTINLYSMKKSWLCERRIKKRLDSFECNYINVKAGEYYLVVELKSGTKKLINQEATLEIEYQNSSEYTGETEDNDTYDTATALQDGVMCEGDYCDGGKTTDTDIYSFVMEKPGKAEIECDNSKNERVSTSYSENVVTYGLYREDENKNVYQISDMNYYENDYWRLPAGKYYIKMKFNADDGYTLLDWVYGIKWTANL